MRIYIESTIPSYVVARPSRDRLLAACQQVTKDWWERKRTDHELFASQIVLDEIADGEATMARMRLETMTGIEIVLLTAEAEVLTHHQFGNPAAGCGWRRSAHRACHGSPDGRALELELSAYRQPGHSGAIAAVG